MTENGTAGKVIITGTTRDGKKFRPSDWAERLAGAFASYGPGRRVNRHPHIRVVTRNGINCVSVDAKLEANDPMAWEFLMRFAESNELAIEREA